MSLLYAAAADFHFTVRFASALASRHTTSCRSEGELPVNVDSGRPRLTDVLQHCE